MTSTCGLRMPVSVRVGELGARLAPGDVDGRDDEVEPAEEIVLVVEQAVRADLELAAVQQAEALRRRLGRCRPGGLLGREPGVQRRDDLALLFDAIRRQAAGDRQRLRVVGQDLVGVAAPAGGLGHDLDRERAVRPFRVAVEVAAQVLEPDEGRQRAREGRLELARLLAQLRLDVRQAEEGVRLGLGLERPQFGRVAGQGLAVLADPQEALLGQAPALVAGHRAEADVVLLGAREMDAVGPALRRAARSSGPPAVRPATGSRPCSCRGPGPPRWRTGRRTGRGPPARRRSRPGCRGRRSTRDGGGTSRPGSARRPRAPSPGGTAGPRRARRPGRGAVATTGSRCGRCPPGSAPRSCRTGRGSSGGVRPWPPRRARRSSRSPARRAAGARSSARRPGSG